MPAPAAIVGEGVEVAAVRQDVVGVHAALRLALHGRLLLMLPLVRMGKVLGVLVGGAAPASFTWVVYESKRCECVYVISKVSMVLSVSLLGREIILVRGLVKFDPAVANHFCPNFPATFPQPRNKY